jgi:PAS domain S-box-containing protein
MILREAGLVAEACGDLDALCRALEDGAGMALVADEALATADLHCLSAWLKTQAPWSDFPFVLLTQRGGGLERNPVAMRAMALLGNVSFVERPFHALTLASAVKAALRARHRQYQARDHLRERAEAAEALAAANQRTAEILESVDLASYAVDPDWRLTYVNHHVERLWGRSREALLGQVLWDLFPGIDLRGSESYRLHMEAVRESRPARGEILSEGLDIWVEVSVHPSPGGLSVYFRDITDRKRAEEQRELLLHELSHRVKNMLAVVQAIAGQTAARAATGSDFMEAFKGRLRALAAAHDLLTARGWQSILLDELARVVLSPHFGPGRERLTLVIGNVPLSADLAQSLSLALHELATNAAKHGALTKPEGQVRLTAEVVNATDGEELRIVWQERDGPPVTRPASHGFGTTLLGRALAHQHDGKVELDWRPEGLIYRMSLRLKRRASAGMTRVRN